MKKILIFVAVIFLVSVVVSSASLSNVALAADGDTEDYKNSEIYLFVSEFLAECPGRNGVTNEKAAAEWLAKKYSALCGTDIEPITLLEGNTAYGYNVEVRLKGTDSKKQIIIGAHFDSVGEGANDNASGIAAMYFVMKDLVESADYVQNKTTSLPFDVVFVAFGGEESGLPMVPPTIKEKPIRPQTLRVRLRHKSHKNRGTPSTVITKNKMFAPSSAPIPNAAPSL